MSEVQPPSRPAQPLLRPRLSRRRKVLFLSILLFGGGGLIWVTGEIALRVLRPQKTFSVLRSYAGDFYAPGDFIPVTLKKSYRTEMPSMEVPGTKVAISTNSHGLRGRELPLGKAPGVKRVLCLGDSYTFGVYCGDNESYPAVLEEAYDRAGKRVEVVNAGYADSWSPDEHYAWLSQRGASFQPDVVTYGFFIGNDITGINPAGWRDLDGAGLPRRVVDPTIRVDEFGTPRSTVADWKSAGNEWVYRVPLLRESHFAVAVNKGIIRLTGHSPWGKNPFEMILQPQTPPDLVEKEKLFLKLVEGMNRKARDMGAVFVLLLIPVNFQVEPAFLPGVVGRSGLSVQRNYFEELKPRLDTLNIEWIDVLSAMKSNPGQTYFPRNGEVHFNPSGNAFTAKLLKEHLDRKGHLDR